MYEYIMNIKLTSDILNIKNIFNYDILKKYYMITNSDILLQILSDEYQYLTCNKYSTFFRSYVSNYTIKNPTKYNNILVIKNNNIYINDYILFPIAKYYKFGINSSYYYFYLNIIKEFPINSNCVIVQTIGPWEINNKELHLFFELEHLLEQRNNCTVKTIFILISYGDDINYNKIIIDNDEKRNYIIINSDNNNNFNNINSFINKTDNIFVDFFSLYSIKSCYTELATLPLLILLYNKLLQCLNINGNLYIQFKHFYIYKPSIQLLYLINELFSKIKILHNNIIFLHLGMIKFSNYKKNINNEFDNIINEYLKHDIYFGQHFSPKTKNILTNCKLLEKNTNKPNTDILIKSITKKKINENFINIFYKAYKKYNKKLSEIYKKIKYINTIIEENNKYKILKNINLIINNNISKSIDYCNNNNIEINDIYKIQKIPNSKEIIKIYFPKKKNINYNNLQLSIDSAYSISKPNDLIKLSKLIKKNTPFIDYIIDGNSNIGIGTIIFSEYFKYVYAVEYNNITCDKLKQNINIYKLKNVTVLCDDIIAFMNNNKYLSSIKYNINNFCIFLDPPWSGYFYKIEKIIDLYLNNINILDLIINMNVKYIYIKVPFNYNFAKLYKSFNNITITKFDGYYIIYIIKKIEI